jgi:hypothetical protein
MSVDGEDKVVGREVIASFKKAKTHGGLGSAARFEFFHVDTGGTYPFGLDRTKDIVNTAKLAKVFDTTGSWLKWKGFPNGKLQGMPAVSAWIADHPEMVPEIRNEVLTAMAERKAKRPKLEVVADAD